MTAVRKQFYKIVICISPLNWDIENAVCRVTANELCHSEWDWNTPVRRASLWKPDVRGGADMICTNRSIDLTPGTLAKGQVIPNLRTDRPVCIIPLDLPSTHLLADGKLNLRFLAEDAGNCTLVLNSGTRIAAAEERGVWTVAISEKHLARLNEICGYIEADGGTYITQYEFSKIEIVDNWVNT